MNLTPLALAAVIAAMTLLSAAPAHADSPPPSTQEAVTANTAFALDLYARLSTADGNLFFSPYSISETLAMTYAGARGDTARQMAKVLRFPASPDRLNQAFAALAAQLDAVRKKGHVQLSIANSLWPDDKYPFVPDYLAMLSRSYAASVTPQDYQHSADAAGRTINDWVAARTNGKITDLIRPGMLNAYSRLVLVNAIYFKGNWISPFKPGHTTNQPFHTAGGDDVRCPLMNQRGDFAYTETPELQALQMPYEGDDLSLLVLLPRDKDGLAALEKTLTADKLAQCIKSLASEKVIVFLPKFKLTRELGLTDTLKSMGMTDAFGDRADFSGMDGQTKWLSISAVLHKAFVDVNEEGTEAAAATAVGVASAAMPAPHPVYLFRADHPFIFLIMDNHSDSILFMGRLTNPRSST